MMTKTNGFLLGDIVVGNRYSYRMRVLEIQPASDGRTYVLGKPETGGLAEWYPDTDLVLAEREFAEGTNQ